jgi:hypothetical protein
VGGFAALPARRCESECRREQALLGIGIDASMSLDRAPSWVLGEFADNLAPQRAVQVPPHFAEGSRVSDQHEVLIAPSRLSLLRSDAAAAAKSSSASRLRSGLAALL